MLKKTDDDGMDLYFTISKTKHNYKTSSNFMQNLQLKRQVGTSDIGSSLSTILHEYQMYLHQPVPNRRMALFGRAKPKGKKALNVYVLTDAVWQPQSNAAEPVESLVATLKELGYPRKQVGIQFIRFGSDPKGIKKLEHLDSGLGLSMYVVVVEEPRDSAMLIDYAGILSMQSPQTVTSGKCSWAQLTNGSMVINWRTTAI